MPLRRLSTSTGLTVIFFFTRFLQLELFGFQHFQDLAADAGLLFRRQLLVDAVQRQIQRHALAELEIGNGFVIHRGDDGIGIVAGLSGAASITAASLFLASCTAVGGIGLGVVGLCAAGAVAAGAAARRGRQWRGRWRRRGAGRGLGGGRLRVAGFNRRHRGNRLQAGVLGTCRARASQKRGAQQQGGGNSHRHLWSGHKRAFRGRSARSPNPPPKYGISRPDQWLRCRKARARSAPQGRVRANTSCGNRLKGWMLSPVLRLKSAESPRWRAARPGSGPRYICAGRPAKWPGIHPHSPGHIRY